MVVLAAVTEPWDQAEEGDFAYRTAAIKHLCVSTKFRRRGIRKPRIALALCCKYAI